MSLCRTDGSIRHNRFYDLAGVTSPRRHDGLQRQPRHAARLRGKRSTGGAIEASAAITHIAWRLARHRTPRTVSASRAAFKVTGKGGSISGEVLEIEPEGERIFASTGRNACTSRRSPTARRISPRRLPTPERYQTVYAREEGSAAAPTAGLHFTDGLLKRVRAMGVQTIFVTLHVWDGAHSALSRPTTPPSTPCTPNTGSFHPKLPTPFAERKQKVTCVISVGTTAVRLLENAASLSADNLPQAGSGWADIFITPGYRLRSLTRS